MNTQKFSIATVSQNSVPQFIEYFDMHGISTNVISTPQSTIITGEWNFTEFDDSKQDIEEENELEIDLGSPFGNIFALIGLIRHQFDDANIIFSETSTYDEILFGLQIYCYVMYKYDITYIE